MSPQVYRAIALLLPLRRPLPLFRSPFSPSLSLPIRRRRIPPRFTASLAERPPRRGSRLHRYDAKKADLSRFPFLQVDSTDQSMPL